MKIIYRYCYFFCTVEMNDIFTFLENKMKHAYDTCTIWILFNLVDLFIYFFQSDVIHQIRSFDCF